MHFGYKNPRQQYCIGDNILSVVEEEKDLGVIIQNDLKVSQQCSKVVKIANQILGMIRKSFQNRSKYIMLLLYKSLVRPHLEYCVQV